jgi:hypothetical protein
MAHYLHVMSFGSHSFCVNSPVQKVHCDRGHIMDRNGFQEKISLSNPQWKAFAEELERTGQKPRTNPDGDVCPRCVCCRPIFYLRFGIGRVGRCIV